MVEHVKRGDDGTAFLLPLLRGSAAPLQELGLPRAAAERRKRERGLLLPALGTRHVRASSRPLLPGVRCFDSQLPGAGLGGLKHCCQKYLGISVCWKRLLPWHKRFFQGRAISRNGKRL